MHTKYIVIAIVFAFLLIIAAYTRIINIDAVLRRYDKPRHPASIVVCDLKEAFSYGSNGRFIIEGYPLRVYSTITPPVVIRLSIATDGKHIAVSDSMGKEFLLGSIVSVKSIDNSDHYYLGFDATDKVTFKSSFSMVPYYHGYFILSPAGMFRYYHYYSFHIEKTSGASLSLKWKYSTYKGDDGKLIPDLFGDKMEGLVKLTISDGK